MVQAFQLASYNILADSYVNPQWYPHVDPKVLQWSRRRLTLAEKIGGLNTDIICLQEVEEDGFALLENSLSTKGYAGVYAKKRRGKPDGCATFWRPGRLRFAGSEAIYYNDKFEGGQNSGHLALVCDFKSHLEKIRIAGTHLRWDKLDKSREEHIGYRQIKELIDNYVKTDDTCHWVICGDLNAQPDSSIIQELTATSFIDAYKGHEQPTCNPNRKAKRIDYIFHTAGLKASPAKLAEINDLTPLPSEDEPSDHLFIMAAFA